MVLSLSEPSSHPPPSFSLSLSLLSRNSTHLLISSNECFTYAKNLEVVVGQKNDCANFLMPTLCSNFDKRSSPPPPLPKFLIQIWPSEASWGPQQNLLIVLSLPFLKFWPPPFFFNFQTTNYIHVIGKIKSTWYLHCHCLSE